MEIKVAEIKVYKNERSLRTADAFPVVTSATTGNASAVRGLK